MKHKTITHYRPVIAASLGCLLAVLLAGGAGAQSAPASESNTNIPANTSGPRNFEGVWWPSMGGGPGGGAGGMGAGGPPGEGGAPGGAPGEGGPPGGGAPGGGAPGGGGPGREAQVTGTTLQCTPVQRLSGSGGGMTTLIVQSDTRLMMVSEEDMDFARKIYIGGTHPAADKLEASPNGHSIAHWEGNTLVIDSTGYSGRDGKDSGQRIQERMSKNGNTLTSEVTTTDNSGNTRKQTQTWAWRPDLQFNENVCEEGFDRYQIIDGSLDNPNIPPGREAQ